MIVKGWQINMHSVVLAEHRLGSGTSARKQRWDDAPPFSSVRKRSKRFRHSIADQLADDLAADLVRTPRAFSTNIMRSRQLTATTSACTPRLQWLSMTSGLNGNAHCIP
jgi:hypothetical protein